MRPSLQSDLPFDRLKKVLIKVAFADHIRQMQTAYRDNSDSQILAKFCRKFLFDKTENTQEEVVVNTKTVIEIIVDGRARALALATLCYGDESLEKGKCLLDYANACALQGSWEIAQERIRKAAEIFSPRSIPSHREAIGSKRLSAIFSAQVVRVIFSVLREHAARNGGKVRESFITELIGVLGRFFPADKSSSNVGDESSGYITRIATALAKFFSLTSTAGGVRSDVQEKTWIMMVHFLRCKSEEIRMLFDAVEGFLLPQHVALLDMPFLICDHKERGVAHPIELARELNSFPSVIKLLSGGVKLAQQLHEMVDKAPIALSKLPGQAEAADSAEGDGVFLTRAVGREEQGVRLFHDLPLTREEYLSCFLLESDAAAAAIASTSSSIQENENSNSNSNIAPSTDYHIDVIRIQVLSLQGVCAIYTDHLPLAEDCFQSALSLLNQWTLETDMVAVELYNSIAQMMIMKHKQGLISRQKQLRKQCEEWLQSDEATLLIKQQCKVIKKEVDTVAKPVSKGEIENRARSVVYKQRLQLLDSNTDASAGAPVPPQSLEAAYRYLLKSFDISETIYGPFHPMVGTACLAVASVQNLAGKLNETKEWLTKSLKSFEKSNGDESALPTPVRAITFTQTQLAQVLQKLGQVDEAMAALTQAVSFHMQEAKHGLLLHKMKTSQSSTGETDAEENEGLVHLAVSPPLLKSSALQTEIDLTLELGAKVLKLAALINRDDGVGAGAGWRGVQLAQEMASINEEAFGWDSVEAAAAYKQVGMRCVSLCDWNRAVKYLKMSVESHVVAFGQKDMKTVQVLRALADARKNRAASRKLTTDDDHSDGDIGRNRSRSRERSSKFDKDASSAAAAAASSAAAGKGRKSNSGRSSSAGRSHYRSVKSMQTRMKAKKESGNNNLLDSFEASFLPEPKVNTLVDVKRRGGQSKMMALLEDDIVLGNEHDFNDFIKKGIFKLEDLGGDETAPPKDAYETKGEEDEDDDSYGDDAFPVSPLSNSIPNSPEPRGRKSNDLVVEVEDDDV